MTDIAISVRNVSKCYRVFDDQRARLMHAIWPRRTTGMQEVWALKDINFEIRRGESVAIIGRNGGGKSTLLEILTGTLQPTTGDVTVHGRVSALLELGSGFNPEYSGRDNVILNGLLLGLSKADILSRFGEIEAFAEIGVAIDRPVKTYSSGMMMRLAFAVQVLCDPDILIVDEALSVGDFFFQQKCLAYIKQLSARGVTLLFVSHDMGTVRDICQRAIYLRTGTIAYNDSTIRVISKYLSESSAAATAKETIGNSSANQLTSGSSIAFESLFADATWCSPDRALDREGKLISVVLRADDGQPAMSFRIGSNCTILVAYVSNMLQHCHIGVTVKNKYGHVVSAVGSYFNKSQIENIPSELSGYALIVCELRINMMLEAGQYALEVNSGTSKAPNRGDVLEVTPVLGPINVVWDYESEIAPFLGQFGVPFECKSYVLNYQ